MDGYALTRVSRGEAGKSEKPNEVKILATGSEPAVLCTETTQNGTKFVHNPFETPLILFLITTKIDKLTDSLSD